MTEAGIILGTAPYMSPEQARGKAVDKHSDIWSFGVVLKQILTGNSPFERARVSDALAAILTETLHWRALPSEVRPLVQACLEKNPKQRLRDIGDAWRLVEHQRQDPVSRFKRWRLASLAAASVALAVLAALGWWRAAHEPV